MDPTKASLPPGRSNAPLNEDQQLHISSLFLGLDNAVPTRYAEDCRSHFEVITENGETFGIVYFGPDIYPGKGDSVNPNSTLPLLAAIAHEVTHFRRWHDGTQINELGLEFIDEALTSLEATVRFQIPLSPFEVQELVRDAMYRLLMFRNAAVSAAEAGLSLDAFINPAPAPAAAAPDTGPADEA